MTGEEQPLVSVIVPCRDEGDFIEKCIRSVLNSEYQADKIEVLVVDGMSIDGTRKIVERLCEQDNRVSLYNNEQKIVPTAMNIGIAAAKGQVIIRVDGHVVVAEDFIKENVRQLQNHPEAWCVGGPIETVSPTYIGRAIAAAMSSPVGVGNAMFRLGNYEGFVDTIAFGAYWRWVFDRIGLFDEELVRHQDDELNLRLIRGGGKIFMTPKIRSRYYPRSTLRKLWRQYYQYGFWRIKTMQMYGRPAVSRQSIPLLFVSSLGLLGLVGIFWKVTWWLLGAEFALLYVLGLL
jgi:glycosyltransferase involved in cell wall biosynthesis